MGHRSRITYDNDYEDVCNEVVMCCQSRERKGYKFVVVEVCLRCGGGIMKLVDVNDHFVNKLSPLPKLFHSMTGKIWTP